MLANIQLNPDIVLDPDLAVVVEKLALKHPGWVFRSPAKVDGMGYTTYESHQRSGGSNIERLGGKRYARKVAVLQDGLNAGTIAVDRNYSRRASQSWHFVVNSPRIDNGRRGSTITTRDAGVALRTASRMFIAPSLRELLHKAVSGARSGLDETLRDLERPLERGQFAPSLVTMQVALYNLLNDVPFDDRGIREKLCNEKYEEALANYELSHRMRVMPMRGIMVFRGSYVYYSDLDDGETDVRTSTFEDLPLKWQEKIAVLQLMKDTELVLDVGYRRDESTFLVVEN